MDIVKYRIKQHLTVYTGEVLLRSGSGSLTGSSVHSCHSLSNISDTENESD